MLPNEVIEITELLIKEDSKTPRVSKYRISYNNLSICVIKCSHGITKLLMLLLQKIKKLGTLDPNWSLIPKEESRSDVTNSKPLTFLPIVSHIFAKLIARTLIEQVAQVNNRAQHGLLPRRRVVIQLLLEDRPNQRKLSNKQITCL